MRLDIDSFKELLDTLTRNKARTILTGFGVFWGIFMLLFLVGGGDGLKSMLAKQLSGFASNSAIAFSNRTSKAYKGFNKGRTWSMVTGDIDRLKALVPELDVVTGQCQAWSEDSSEAIYEDKKSSISLVGLEPDFRKVEEPTLRYGRYINEMDVEQSRKVCVIGKEVYNTLFPGQGDPCGKRIKIGPAYYTVIGVDWGDNSAVQISGPSSQKVSIPMTTLQSMYNFGDQISIIAVTVKGGHTMSEVIPDIRKVIADNHYIDPTDETGVTIINTESFYLLIDNLFRGVNFLIWLIGIGTIFAGAIGVSNIMMVTVRERTSEIGIRRAIGATPKMILSQIMSESMLLTAVAGMLGILFSVLILQGLELAVTQDGILQTPFQIGFWTALLALVLVIGLGAVAGLPPAFRAMAIKPVDAMRDE